MHIMYTHMYNTKVQARQAQQTAARLAEATSDCTFKPQVSERSQQIMQGMGTDFITRQQRHLAKREKMVSSFCNVSLLHHGLIQGGEMGG